MSTSILPDEPLKLTVGRVKRRQLCAPSPRGASWTLVFLGSVCWTPESLVIPSKPFIAADGRRAHTPAGPKLLFSLAV